MVIFHSELLVYQAGYQKWIEIPQLHRDFEDRLQSWM